MSQVIIRNLDADVVARLKARAERAKKPLEQTLREIITEAAKPSKEELLAELDAIRALSTFTTIDAVDLIREDRDR